MIGGTGEKKTLRLVAQYADACNLFAGPQAGPDVIRAKLDVLQEHCARLGHRLRPHPQDDPVDGAGRPGRGRWTGVRRADARFADVGIDEVHVMPFTDDPVSYIQGLGDHVVGQLAAL